MKKVIVVLSMLILMCTNAYASGVIIDGVAVPFNDSTGYPFVDENSRTQVPLRATMEALGAEVDWDAENNCAVVRKGPTTVVCYIGESCVYRNNTRIKNDSPAVAMNGRTYLPIRVVAESFDAKVGWDGNVLITTGAAGNLIHQTENSGMHVSNLWACWQEALDLKNSGNYSLAIEKFKTLAPDFIAQNDGNSNAMLYMHLGECYSKLGQNAEASVCFKREAQFWESMGKVQETIDANRRATIINASIQMYAETGNESYAPKAFGAVLEPKKGLYIGAYAESDPSVHYAGSMDKFYMNEFPKLVGKDMSAYLIYMPSTTPLSNYQSHIEVAKEKNKIMKIALEPVGFFDIQPNDPTYIKLAKDMEESGVNFFVRFASEMNDTSCPWYTTDYNKYIEKFRIVADIFHTYAPSCAVVWSPNFYPPDNIHLYYPGDKYVDYVGISSYMNHQPETDPLGQGIDRNRWSEQLDKIVGLYGYKKPIIISESGASYRDYATGADITAFSSNQLYDFYTYLPIKYPSVKGAFLFDSDDGNYKMLLSGNQAYLDSFKNAISSSQYLSSQNDGAGLTEYFELGENVAVEAKKTNVYSFVKTPANDTGYVIYSINDAYAGQSSQIPYKTEIDFSPYKGTTVSLKLSVYNTAGQMSAEKTYNLIVE